MQNVENFRCVPNDDSAWNEYVRQPVSRTKNGGPVSCHLFRMRLPSPSLRKCFIYTHELREDKHTHTHTHTPALTHTQIWCWCARVRCTCFALYRYCLVLYIALETCRNRILFVLTSTIWRAYMSCLRSIDRVDEYVLSLSGAFSRLHTHTHTPSHTHTERSEKSGRGKKGAVGGKNAGERILGVGVSGVGLEIGRTTTRSIHTRTPIPHELENYVHASWDDDGNGMVLYPPLCKHNASAVMNRSPLYAHTYKAYTIHSILTVVPRAYHDSSVCWPGLRTHQLII